MNLKKQILIGLGAGFCLFLFLGGVKFFQIRAAMAQQASRVMPPEAVTAIKAELVPWPETIEASGTLTPEHGVTISAEEGGVISKINFESGDQIKKDDLIISIDSSVEEADLRGAKAMLDMSRKNVERVRKLKETKAISQAEVDRTESEYRNAQSTVDSLAARIEKKQIKAPFAGKAGVRMVNVGQYVDKGAPLAPLYSDEKLYIDFTVPQRLIPRVQVGQSIKVYSTEGLIQGIEGVVQGIDPQIDETTRQVRVRGIVTGSPNVRPGMFVRVEVVTNKDQKFIALPTSSIQFAPYGNSVFVIEQIKGPDEKEYLGVKQRNVEVGPRRGDQVAVIKGLEGGEQVVTSGLFKLREGAAVQIAEGKAPQADAHPNPQDS